MEVRRLKELHEFDRCVELQVAVWGYSDGDVIPRRMFLLADRIGGQVLGAVSEGLIVGFAMALPGYREGVPYLHSHMLAVLPEFRNGGLGRRLKLAQRDDALERGFALMEWTFDPLEIKNAHLNLCKLGAICRRYQENFYGVSSSPLQGGLPTDRLYAEWWMDSDHVRRALAGEPEAAGVERRVRVPGEVAAWKASQTERGLAASAQAVVREGLLAGFADGLAAVGYEREADGSGSYLLGRWGGSEELRLDGRGVD